jgi:predicted DNA-binding transcriptional regulator AlpA
MERLLYRVREFCAAHAISPVTFYKLLAEGQGPRITRIGGGTFISADDAAEWRRRMAEATDQSVVRGRDGLRRRSHGSEP